MGFPTREAVAVTELLVSLGQVELRVLLTFSLLIPEQHDITVEGVITTV